MHFNRTGEKTQKLKWKGKHMRVKLPLLLALVFSLSACPGAKKVDSEKVLEDVVVAMCKKMVTCQPAAMPNEDFCKNTMKTAMASNKDLPKVEATQKQVDECVASIASAECQNLMGSEPPKGCEFLK